MSKTWRIVIVVFVVVVVLLIVAKKQGWIGGEDGLAVSTTKVELADITETVIASGKIQPEVELMISSEVSGEIVKLPVREGQKVKKGDLLVKINPDIYLAAVNRAEAAVNSSKAALASAKAQLLEAEKSYKRNKKLHEQNVISQAEFDAAQRAYDVARLNVESSRHQLSSNRASLKEARDNLSRTTIYAPQDGTISRLNSELGERVVGTAQMTGTDIMHLSDLENMEVLVEVNENDIIRVEHHDTALIEVDAYLDEEFRGVVTEIANSAKLEASGVDQVTNFEVKVRILKSSYAHLVDTAGDAPFRPGMTASLDILTERREDVVAVPIEAVTTRQDTSSDLKSYGIGRGEDKATDQDFEVVFLYNEGDADLQVVKTGIQNDELIEIKKGLSEGQEIITGPYSVVSKKLVNGEEVRRKNSDKDEESDEED